MKAQQQFLLTERQVELAYQALLYYRDMLGTYRSWLKDKEAKPLPGVDTALEEIQKEQLEYMEFVCQLFNCFSVKQDGSSQ